MLDRSPRRSVSNFRDRVGGGSVNMGVRPLNQLADDGDLTVGNPRNPIFASTRCVMDRHDLDPRDRAHYRRNVLRRVAQIGGSIAMASSLQHL